MHGWHIYFFFILTIKEQLDGGAGVMNAFSCVLLTIFTCLWDTSWQMQLYPWPYGYNLADDSSSRCTNGLIKRTLTSNEITWLRSNVIAFARECRSIGIPLLDIYSHRYSSIIGEEISAVMRWKCHAIADNNADSNTEWFDKIDSTHDFTCKLFQRARCDLINNHRSYMMRHTANLLFVG